MTNLDRFRYDVDTASGRASYLDTGGDGPPVLFVHGIGTSSRRDYAETLPPADADNLRTAPAPRRVPRSRTSRPA